MNKNLKGIDLALLKYLNALNSFLGIFGHVAEWLRRGLQILLSQFDSGRGLQKNWLFYFFKKSMFIFIPR